MRSHNAKSIEHDKVDSELLLKVLPFPSFESFACFCLLLSLKYKQAVKEMIDKRVGTIENGLSHTLAGLLNTPG